MFKFKKIFIKISTLFFGIVIGLFFISVDQVKAEGEDCNEDLPCEGDGEICVGATDDEFGECRGGGDLDGDISVGGSCRSGSDCQAGLVCQDNTCTLSGDGTDGRPGDGGSMCTGDSDCTGSLECVGGICTSVDSSDGGGNGGSGDVVHLQSPINIEGPVELVAAAIRGIMGVIGIVAVAALIYGAILYFTSGGSEEQAGKAKKAITYAIIGLVVSILSYVIINTLIRAIGG